MLTGYKFLINLTLTLTLLLICMSTNWYLTHFVLILCWEWSDRWFVFYLCDLGLKITVRDRAVRELCFLHVSTMFPPDQQHIVMCSTLPVVPPALYMILEEVDMTVQ